MTVSTRDLPSRREPRERPETPVPVWLRESHRQREIEQLFRDAHRKGRTP